MLLKWFRNRRRRKLLSTPPPAWLESIESLGFHAYLNVEERATLRDLTRVFVAEKYWEGCGGLELTDAMKASIAAQACLLLLGIEHDYYHRVLSIFVYPTTFATPCTSDETRESARLGEAWYRGPVVLAWDAVELGGRNPSDNRNVVLHEFAHKLDYLNGFADGMPPMPDDAARRRWIGVMDAGYQELVEDTRRRRPHLLDEYGSTNAAEFFAVATETFFERGAQLAKKQPQIYEVLRQYYRQDPASWRRAVP